MLGFQKPKPDTAMRQYGEKPTHLIQAHDPISSGIKYKRTYITLYKVSQGSLLRLHSGYFTVDQYS